MGKLYNYEVQVYDKVTALLSPIGAVSYKEALQKLLEEAQRLGSTLGYIWPQTKKAKKKINNLKLRTLSTIDYLQVDIEINTPERRSYSVAGKNV